MNNNLGVNIFFWKFCFFFVLSIFIVHINYTLAQDTFEDAIRIDKKISFDNIFDKIPSLSIDKKGNFIVTDTRKPKVSYYGEGGNLLFTYGREGRGPGDFLRPTYTIKLSSGELLTADFQGKISIFNASGDSLIKIHNVKLLPLTELHEIDENRILLVGRNRTEKDPKLLHIFDLSKGHITKSFLSSFFLQKDDSYGRVFSIFESLTAIDVKDGKIAAMIVPFTTIEIYDYNAKLIRTINLSLKNFKKIEKINQQISPRKFDEYITTFSIISNIFWLNDDSFIIDYYRLTEFERLKSSKRQYSLAKIKSDGNILFEISDTPNLRVVHKDTLYFDNPNYESETDLLKGVILKNKGN